MSGDMNTSLGNIIQMCCMIHSILRRNNITASFINDGDDGVIFLEQRDLPKLLSIIEKECLIFGHEVTLEEPAYCIEQIEFCQCKFIFRNENEVVAVRDIKSSFDKDSVCLDPLDSPRYARKWMRAVGDCGLSLTSGLPVLQWYYQLFRDQSDVAAKHLRSEGLRIVSKGMGDPKFAPVTALCRYSYWKAFGVSPDQQMEQEVLWQKTEIDHVINTWKHKFKTHPLHLL